MVSTRNSLYFSLSPPIGEVERLLKEHQQNQELVDRIGSNFYQIIYPVQLRHHEKMGISTREVGAKVRYRSRASSPSSPSTSSSSTTTFTTKSNSTSTTNTLLHSNNNNNYNYYYRNATRTRKSYSNDAYSNSGAYDYDHDRMVCVSFSFSQQPKKKSAFYISCNYLLSLSLSVLVFLGFELSVKLLLLLFSREWLPPRLRCTICVCFGSAAMSCLHTVSLSLSSITVLVKDVDSLNGISQGIIFCKILFTLLFFLES